MSIWDTCDAVERVPGKVSGAWLFRGTRLPLSHLFVNLASGASIDGVLEWFDGLDKDAVCAVFAHLADITSGEDREARAVATRPETGEEFEARMLSESEAVDAGAYDDIRALDREYMLSQIPDGYVFKDGYFVRTDPDLPDHFWIASVYDGKPTGQMVKVTAV